jgi:Ca2+-binding RTX toxin-like protein
MRPNWPARPAMPAAPATMRWPASVPSGHGTDADAGEYLNITGIENVGWVQGSNFNDVITLPGFNSATNFNSVYAMGGDDKVWANLKTQYLSGGEGNDLLDGRASESMQRIDGDAGNDTIYTNPNSPQGGAAYGGEGNDTIYGHNYVSGGGGNDIIYMQVGSYSSSGSVFGDDGDDEIHASNRGNSIEGGAGADRLIGGDDNDYLRSGSSVGDPSQPVDIGAEHDILTGGAGYDILAAGYGDDVDGGDDEDTLLLALTGATAGVTLNTAQFANGNSAVVGGGTIKNIERVERIWGSAFADKITVGDQAGIWLDGAAGNDTLTLTSGTNEIRGGAGKDIIHGGSGEDTIIYEYAADLKAGEVIDGGGGYDTLQTGAPAPTR